MTRTGTARTAGFTLLFYIVIGVAQTVIGAGVTAGSGPAARVASMAQHAMQVRINVVLGLLMFVNAVILAVALYGITRDEDRDIAAMAMMFRVCEALLGALQSLGSLGLLWIATVATPTANAQSDAASYAVADVLFRMKAWNVVLGSFSFAVGSLLFAYLFLRSRSIPVWLAWVGVIASVLLVVLIPAQLVGVLQGSLAQAMWIPMAAFEIPLGLFLLVKGVRSDRLAMEPP